MHHNPFIYPAFLYLLQAAVSQELRYVHVDANLTAVPDDIQSEVTYIDLSHNEIERLEDNAFFGLHSLEHLDVSNNKLTFISDLAFNGTIIKKLLLHMNQLSALPKFGTIGETLTNLKVDDNGIRSVEGPEFTGVKRLEVLSIRDNQLERFDPDISSEAAESIKELLLNGNELREIKPSLFTGMRNLNTLSVYNNELSSIPSFEMLPQENQLKYLSIDANPIGDLPDNALEKLTKLVFLDVSDMQLSTIPHMEHQKQNLKIVYFGRNDISHIDDHAFEGFHITSLDFSANKLTQLPNLSPLSSTLSLVDLSNNKFGDIPCKDMLRFLYTMKNLKILYLVNVGLTTFPDPRILERTFEYLYISNPSTLVCDCALSWLEDISSLMVDDSWYRRDILPSSQPCRKPDTFQGRRWEDITKDDLCRDNSTQSCSLEDILPLTTTTEPPDDTTAYEEEPSTLGDITTTGDSKLPLTTKIITTNEYTTPIPETTAQESPSFSSKVSVTSSENLATSSHNTTSSDAHMIQLTDTTFQESENEETQQVSMTTGSKTHHESTHKYAASLTDETDISINGEISPSVTESQSVDTSLKTVANKPTFSVPEKPFVSIFVRPTYKNEAPPPSPVPSNVSIAQSTETHHGVPTHLVIIICSVFGILFLITFTIIVLLVLWIKRTRHKDKDDNEAQQRLSSHQYESLVFPAATQSDTQC